MTEHTALKRALADIAGEYEQSAIDTLSSSLEYKKWEQRSVVKILKATAAPELLEALEVAVEYLPHGAMYYGPHNLDPRAARASLLARAAIAKARGE